MQLKTLSFCVLIRNGLIIQKLKPLKEYGYLISINSGTKNRVLLTHKERKDNLEISLVY